MRLGMLGNSVKVADFQMVDRRVRTALGAVSETLKDDGSREDAHSIRRAGFTNPKWLACELFVLLW